VVYCEICTKGSGTAKSGTDEQEPYKRLSEMGKQTQHCEARNQQISFSRYGRGRIEVFTLTGGDLPTYEIGLEKSAEAIIIAETSRANEIDKQGGLTKQ
jgi:hypothetical protein